MIHTDKPIPITVAVGMYYLVLEIDLDDVNRFRRDIEEDSFLDREIA